MLTLWRRMSSSSSLPAAVTSVAPMCTVPAVGSMSRVRQRTRVDLPLPDSPITTKTSPGATVKLTSRMATTQPVFASSSARGRSTSGVPTTRAALAPNTFHKPATEIAAPEIAAPDPFVDRPVESAERSPMGRA